MDEFGGRDLTEQEKSAWLWSSLTKIEKKVLMCFVQNNNDLSK